MVVDDVCCLYLCRFVGLKGVSATPTPQISWHKTTSARFRLLCHLLCTKSSSHLLCSLQFILLLMPKEPTYAVVRASIMGQGLTVWMLRRFLDVFRLFYKKSKDHFIKSMLDLLKLQVVLETNLYLFDSPLRL